MLYDSYVRQQVNFWNFSLDELNGCVLGCWCSSQPYHVDLLVRLFEEIDHGKEEEKMVDHLNFHDCMCLFMKN